MAQQIKIFDPAEVTAYFKGEKKSVFYQDAKDKHDDFLPHSDGVKPMRIINKQRPNEPEIVKEFRLEIWEPITKPTFSRVVSSLGKIRRSSDWSIIYPDEEFNLIREGNELESYCEKDFPYFTSVTNWIFGVFLKSYLIDSNGVVLVMPLSTDIDETEYLQPFTNIYSSCDVIDFKSEEYAVLNVSEGCIYKDEKGNAHKGKSILFVTSMRIERRDQIDERGNSSIVYEYDHNLGFMPAFKNGGVICNSNQNTYLYESKISGILPNLNEAVAEYTDLQAGKRLNIYPERWEYSNHECPKCKGTGIINNQSWRPGQPAALRQHACGSCVNGYIPSGPFSKMVVKPVDVTKQAVPTPPAGYIEKDIEIIRLMDESVDKHIYKALAAINFQFLDQVPMNQSGVAKEVDKEELNNTVHSIAEDIVAMMDNIYKSNAYYRYSKLYPIEEIDKMLPKIPVPEHFDLISSQYMQEEIDRARKAQINPLLISEMEVEFSGKRFPMDSEVNKVIRLAHKLDPLPGRTVEEKIGMSSNKTITRQSNVISDNIVYFIRRALFENQDFETWDLSRQEKLLASYADQQISAMDEAAKLIAQALMSSDQDEDDNTENEDDAGNVNEENMNEQMNEENANAE